MEPERPIEKLLRDYAKKRRDEAGAPFEMHPATRRMLQAEVARELARGQKSSESVRRRFQPWIVFAGALGILVVLGVAVALLLPEGPSSSNASFAELDQAAKPAPGDLAYARREEPPLSQVSPPAFDSQRKSVETLDQKLSVAETAAGRRAQVPEGAAAEVAAAPTLKFASLLTPHFALWMQCGSSLRRPQPLRRSIASRLFNRS